MPPRKRTNQYKRTPPASPDASTSHVPAGHHLRHTGPRINASASTGAAPPKPLPAPAGPKPTPKSPPTQQDPHEKGSIAKVPPLSARTSFAKLLYVLFFSILLLLGWYVYGMVTLLERLKDEVGWWSIVVDDPGRPTRRERWGFKSDLAGESGGPEVVKGGDLEGSLNALADALGISPMQVASAVKPLIPQASLTGMASKAEETGGSEAVRMLFEDTTRSGEGRTESG